jgi:hypothetical protein
LRALLGFTHSKPDIIPPNLLEPFLHQSVIIFIAHLRYIDHPQKILQCDVLFARWKLVVGWRGIKSNAPFARVGSQIQDFPARIREPGELHAVEYVGTYDWSARSRISISISGFDNPVAQCLAVKRLLPLGIPVQTNTNG